MLNPWRTVRMTIHIKRLPTDSEEETEEETPQQHTEKLGQKIKSIRSAVYQETKSIINRVKKQGYDKTPNSLIKETTKHLKIKILTVMCAFLRLRYYSK